MANLIAAELPLILGLLTTGIVAGLLAGLLGVGGGIVIVPVLFTVLGAIGVDIDIRLQMAIGTSLATIIPTSLSSLHAHHKKEAVDWDLFRHWLPALVIGVISGTWLATTQVSGPALALIFAMVAIVVALDLVVRDRSKTDDQDEQTTNALWIYRLTGSWAPLLIGALSSMMGIGGGTLSVPFLNALRYPMHKAVATSAGFGLIIAVPATIGYVIGGWNTPDRPFASLGYVNGLGFVIIAIMTVWTAPIGSRIAHALSPKTLRFLFAAFLTVTAIRMFIAFY